MIFLGITIWAFKEGLLFVEEFTKIKINVEDFLGVISAVILSYGLFLVVAPLRRIFKSKGKEEKKRG